MLGSPRLWVRGTAGISLHLEPIRSRILSMCTCAHIWSVINTKNKFTATTNIYTMSQHSHPINNRTLLMRAKPVQKGVNWSLTAYAADSFSHIYPFRTIVNYFFTFTTWNINYAYRWMYGKWNAIPVPYMQYQLKYDIVTHIINLISI